MLRGPRGVEVYALSVVRNGQLPSAWEKLYARGPVRLNFQRESCLAFRIDQRDLGRPALVFPDEQPPHGGARVRRRHRGIRAARPLGCTWLPGRAAREPPATILFFVHEFTSSGDANPVGCERLVPVRHDQTSRDHCLCAPPDGARHAGGGGQCSRAARHRQGGNARRRSAGVGAAARARRRQAAGAGERRCALRERADIKALKLTPAHLEAFILVLMDVVEPASDAPRTAESPS